MTLEEPVPVNRTFDERAIDICDSFSIKAATSFRGPDCHGVLTDTKLLALLQHKPLMDTLSAGRILKEDKKRRVAVIKLETSKQIFVKIHFDNSPFDSLRSKLSSSRAQRSHDKALTLIEHGIATPDSLGFANFNTGKRAGSAHFTNFLKHSQTMTEALHSAPDLHQRWVALGFQNLASLHNHGFIHGDLKLNNLMLQNQQLYYVDIDSARQTTQRRARLKDLARFLVALSETDVSQERIEKPFGDYCHALELNKKKVSPEIKRIAHRIQRKHLLKYGRLPRQIL